jgi:hypothetical protein
MDTVVWIAFGLLIALCVGVVWFASGELESH